MKNNWISIKKALDDYENKEQKNCFDVTIDELMSTICTIAILKYGGHFTILSFTNHYKGGFGTITDRNEIEQMCGYGSFKQLLINMINNELI
jgi:hypothetical protein